MAILSINGSDLPDPASLSIGYQDLDSDNTKRNEKGVLQRDRVRGNVHKLSVKWKTVSDASTAQILQAVSDASFQATFHDPRLNAETTITAYVGDRSDDAIATQVGGRWDISFDIIEY